MNCRQNWSTKSEEALNLQINMEYYASLSYHVLSNYFDRDDVGLDKLVEYYKKASLEEREHADKLMVYQNMRGGLVKLGSISINNVELHQPNDILDSFKMALQLEKDVNEHLLNLHKVASDENDPQFCDYLEGEFLKEQVEAISEISKTISILERFKGDQHAIWNYVNNL